MEKDLAKILITEADIRAKVLELGQLITEAYQGRQLLVVGILKGSVVFMSDLIRAINLPLEIDFMEVSSYGKSTQSSGAVRILKDLATDLAGWDVLIVEDIIDTGLTLTYLSKLLRARKPASLKICTFLDKPSRRKSDVRADFTGYEIPDEFAVGYGLDFGGKYRNLPYVAVLKPELY